MPWQCHGQTPGWAHLLSKHRVMATLLEDQTSEGANPDEYNEVVFMRNTETIEAFPLGLYP